MEYPELPEACKLLISYYSNTDRNLNFVCVQPANSLNQIYRVSHTLKETDTPDFILFEADYKVLMDLIRRTNKVFIDGEIEVFEMCRCTLQGLNAYVNTEVRKAIIDELLADLETA